VGSIRQTLGRYPHLKSLLPAMGYGETQRRELEDTINRTPCDLVLVATPVDLARLLHLNKPSLRVSYDVEERSRPGFREILAEFSARWEPLRRAKSA
jgi:predicted GTPase